MSRLSHRPFFHFRLFQKQDASAPFPADLVPGAIAAVSILAVIPRPALKSLFVCILRNALLKKNCMETRALYANSLCNFLDGYKV